MTEHKRTLLKSALDVMIPGKMQEEQKLGGAFKQLGDGIYSLPRTIRAIPPQNRRSNITRYKGSLFFPSLTGQSCQGLHLRLLTPLRSWTQLRFAGIDKLEKKKIKTASMSVVVDPTFNFFVVMIPNGL
ncbi:hypothetical protein SADUNF_Sadunf03G0132000 [Salix dunnii]|uniref:Uncharacterized protein n=1 Tax=Salix dunnii TaxID=1413687 RepID=A0A835N4L8_9ROSI|nr:hypothetical protein SADUNF_Sadunf03G0132000 [Salix dunnii]